MAIKKLKHITVICRELYEEKGASAVYDYVKDKPNIHEMYCTQCEVVTPHWSGECLICGNVIKTAPLNLKMWQKPKLL